jgi:hypothetical protein
LRVSTRIERGDFYEDCASQPVICTEVDYAALDAVLARMDAVQMSEEAARPA